MPAPSTNLRGIEDFLDKFARDTAELSTQLAIGRKVTEAAHTVGESWSGSCMGYHTLLYYRDFQRPDINNRFSSEWGLLHGIPPGWSERSVEEIEAHIREIAGVDLKSFQDAVDQYGRLATQLKDDVLLELVGVVAKDDVHQRLLSEIEQIEWGNAEQSRYVVGQVNASPHMTRDAEAINAGFRVPVHTFYEGLVIKAEAFRGKGTAFVRSCRMLIRRMEAAPVQHDSLPAAKRRPESSGATVLNVTGPNARVNISSHDESLNITSSQPAVFEQLRRILQESAIDNTEKERLAEEVRALEDSHQGRYFLEGYQRFIGAVADHMTVFGPIIPVLTKLLGG